MTYMGKWEYAQLGLVIVNGHSRVIWNGPDGTRDLGARDFVEQLNHAGGAGWEAVGYTSTMDSRQVATGNIERGIHAGHATRTGTVSCLLKRPLE
jgi:hypothetical protein